LDGSNTINGPSNVGDVRDALSGLGYSTEEIRDVLREISVSNDSESMLREALNMLGARRA
jgi:Holliday junction resolvasome RuvABC DNA-binding subunit